MSIVLIDTTSDSLTVSWPEDGVAPPATRTTTNSSNKTTTTTNNTNKNRTYHLQYRLYTKDDDNNNDTNKYETLSNSLRTCIIRKKNLVDLNRQGFMFRVCIIYPNSSGSLDESYYEWMTHTEPFHLLSVEEERYQLAAPKVQYGGTNASIVIQWNAFPIETCKHSSSSTERSKDNDDDENKNTTVSYEIQMREYVGGTPWTTIVSNFTGNSTCSGNINSGKATHQQEQLLQVRKNNCVSIHGYQFRIRPIIMTRHGEQQENSSIDTDGKSTPFTPTIPFSSPSDPPIIPLSYTTTQLALQQRLLLSSLSNNDTILSNQGGTLIKRPVQDCLGGKELILLYVSAHWCGPCRQFTPKLVQWYSSIVGYNNNNNKNSTNTNTSFMEIVFISADHDEASFVSYYQTMPWTAIDYETDSTVREHIMSPRVLNVRGIPQLAVVCGRTGNILHTNMVGQPLQNIQSFRK